MMGWWGSVGDPTGFATFPAGVYSSLSDVAERRQSFLSPRSNAPGAICLMNQARTTSDCVITFAGASPMSYAKPYPPMCGAGR
jgi:hypothetical protein